MCTIFLHLFIFNSTVSWLLSSTAQYLIKSQLTVSYLLIPKLLSDETKRLWILLSRWTFWTVHAVFNKPVELKTLVLLCHRMERWLPSNHAELRHHTGLFQRLLSDRTEPPWTVLLTGDEQEQFGRAEPLLWNSYLHQFDQRCKLWEPRFPSIAA